MHRARGGIIALAASVLVACGVRARSAAEPPAPAAVADEWTALTWEERHDVMTWTVLPTMGRMFQRFDGETAPDLTCRTCHGPDPEAVAYRMPRGLPALDPAHMPSARSSDPREARVVTFMAGEVVPRMRELLGAPSLGCFTCHSRAQ
jgi:hypothetical protein